MIIDCISDLHGRYPELPGGDLLIVAGDLTKRDTPEEYSDFAKWISSKDYKKIIIIAGNHDNCLDDYEHNYFFDYDNIDYLQDNKTEFERLKIWGSPWTLRFDGMNPKCMAFTKHSDDSIAKKWDLIPDDIDILITHMPPYGIFDKVVKDGHIGSKSLRNNVISDRFPKLKLHVFGHIHEHGGKIVDFITTKFVNASHVNEIYDPVHPPVRIIL